MCVSTLGYVLQSKTIQEKTIKEHYMNKKDGTLLQKAENIVNALELDVLFTTEITKNDLILNSTPENRL